MDRRIPKRSTGIDSQHREQPFWVNLNDDELLGIRLCDLRLSLKGSALVGHVRQLFQELDARGLSRLRPRVYLGDEWFSPEGALAISVPFYLAHPRLSRLEERLIGEVEGGTPEWCMKLLRHEAGHCFDHLWRVSRRPRWRELFGSPAQAYDPDNYRADPSSRDFAVNLPGHYAQAHPDEDFAETFAVWLTPGEDWETRYGSWPKALAKLRYVDELAREVSDRRGRPTTASSICRASRLKRRLAEHYAGRLGVTPRTVWELGGESLP